MPLFIIGLLPIFYFMQGSSEKEFSDCKSFDCVFCYCCVIDRFYIFLATVLCRSGSVHAAPENAFGIVCRLYVFHLFQRQAMAAARAIMTTPEPRSMYRRWRRNQASSRGWPTPRAIAASQAKTAPTIHNP